LKAGRAVDLTSQYCEDHSLYFAVPVIISDYFLDKKVLHFVTMDSNEVKSYKFSPEAAIRVCSELGMVS